MAKKRSKTNLDADIKKAEGSSPKVKGKNKQEEFNLFDILPKEALGHFQTSQRELLQGFKIAMNGMMDEMIEGSDKAFK